MKKRFSLSKKWMLGFLLVMASFLALKAQPPIDLFNIQEITLKNGTKVILFGKAHNLTDMPRIYPATFKPALLNNLPLAHQVKTVQAKGLNANPFTINKPSQPITAKDNEYYYLPTNLRISVRPDNGVPQFLFMKYTTDKTEAQGGISGAKLHFLMEWGLSEEMRKECEVELRKRVTGAKVVGPARVESGDGPTFAIISATVNAASTGSTRTINMVEKAPLLPGQKIAVASDLTANGAQLLDATFQNKTAITDLSVCLKYKYQAKVPACKGKIIVHWDKVADLSAKYLSTQRTERKEVSRGGFFGWLADGLFGKNNVVVKKERSDSTQISNTSESNKTIEIIFDENYTDERVTAIRDTYLQIAQDMIAKSLEIDEAPLIDFDDKETKAAFDEQANKLSNQYDNYDYIMSRVESVKKKGKQTLDLNFGLMVEREYFITENLSTWYDAVKDNKNCITTVNLDDPFFKHNVLRIIMDNATVDLITNKLVNHVSVNVKKNRSSGNSFTDHVTIDQDYINKNGLSATISYANAADTNPETFEYATQWTFPGGVKYPATPKFIKGETNDVPLELPVEPRLIEFEGDLEKLKNYNISRATLQIRYYKFGEEYEENLDVSPAKGEALVKKMILTDKKSRGYAYRLVLNHTVKGKMALPWSVQVNDNYVYAVIPDELADQNSEVFNKAIDAAKTILNPPPGGKVVDHVLDSFKEVLGIFN